MDLELASGTVLRGVTADDILQRVEGEDFAILRAGPESYIQCGEQLQPPWEYELEHRDGSADRHYRAADGPVTLDRVVSAFLGYLDDDPSWRAAFRWEHIDFS